MSGGTFTIPSSIFLISQSSSKRLRLDTSLSTLSGLFVRIIGGCLSDLVRLCPDLVLSALESLDSRPIPESWLELELFLEDSSLLELTLESRWRSLLFLLAPCLCLVLAAALEDWVRVRPRGCGDPVGEFFSRLLRVSSRRLVCGVRPAPVPELKQALLQTWSEVPGFNRSTSPGRRGSRPGPGGWRLRGAAGHLGGPGADPAAGHRAALRAPHRGVLGPAAAALAAPHLLVQLGLHLHGLAGAGDLMRRL